MIQRISDIEGPPVVGKYYLVPCVLMKFGEWIPVIGPAHDDKEYIGLDMHHYHRDLRFTSDAHNESITPFHYTDPDQFAMIRVIDTEGILDGPVERRIKCRRQMPDFPTRLYLETGRYRSPTWTADLERAYESVQLSPCLKCPHRGMDLKNLPVKDNIVICNGHGLAWDITTGRIVSRLTERTA